MGTLGLSSNSFDNMREYRNLESHLIQSLIDCLQCEDVEDVDFHGLRNASLLASAWQKAIRRGDEVLACSSAVSLWDVDRNYVWRRIRCIAMEDVSVANLGLVAQVVAISSKAALRDRIGDRKVLIHLTRMLARSLKCRTGCELLVWRSDSAYAIDRSDVPIRCSVLEAVSDVDRLAGLVDAWIQTEDHSVRSLGVWRRVNRSSGERRQRYLDAVGASELVRYVASKGTRTDRLNTLIPVVDPLMRASADVVKDRRLTHAKPEIISGYPDYSFCLYSKPGREALRRMLRCTNWGARLSTIGVSNLVGALGSLVFYVEGGACLSSLQVAHGLQIQAISQTAQLGSLGVPAASIAVLLDDIRRDLPLVNSYRRKVDVSGSGAHP